MSNLKLGELFAGYGGLGMAMEQVFDAELAWYAEFDDAPSKIMEHHWPSVPNHRDVTTVDWASVEPVDIISGGSPCQDLSHAGRRKGMTEGTRSNLWVSMREAIATIKPTYVVWENVRGAYSAKATSEMEPCPGCMGTDGGDGKHVLRALGRVLGDLHDLGYDAQWRGLRAADVGAPHGRFRVFILATRRDATGHAKSFGMEGHRSGGVEVPPAPAGPQLFGRPGGADQSESTATDADNLGSNRGGEQSEKDGWGEPAHSGHATPDAEHDGHAPTPRRRSNGTATTPRRRKEREQANHDGEPTRGHTPNSEPGNVQTNWGVYAPAIARWETRRGTAPVPTELTPKGKHRLNAAFAEWMMGLDPGHVTQVPGISRNEQLKALGNGVVPQQAVAALMDMLGQPIASVEPVGKLFHTPDTTPGAGNKRIQSRQGPQGLENQAIYAAGEHNENP